MGWFDYVSQAVDPSGHRRSSHSSSSKHHHHSSSSSKRQRDSTARSLFGLGDEYNTSRGSFFGIGGRSGTSSYRRSPRKSYLNNLLHRLRRLFRDLLYYMKKNPVKVFMLVIMPLITGGALTALLAKVGIRLPHGVEKVIRAMGGDAGGGRGMGGMGGGRGGWERTTDRFERGGGGLASGLGEAVGAMGGAGGLLSVAKMFI